MRKLIRKSGFLVFLIAFMLLCIPKQVQAAETNNQFSTMEEAVNYLSQAMVERQENVRFYLRTRVIGSTPTQEITDAIHLNALAHTEECSGQAGDTLYWSVNRLSYVYDWANGYYIFDYTIKYDTTYAQEQELTKKYNEVMAGMNFNGKSEYEKVKMIHDYLCDNINYDDFYKKNSAYYGLCEGISACEGYAMLFYRMCKDVDLSVRIVGGKRDDGGDHCWNIVKIGGVYYNIDVSWDGQGNTISYNHFLKNDAELPGRTRWEMYSTEEFYAQYPMSATSYKEVVPLKISSQPVSQTVNQGENATFAVQATGEGLTYQWQYKLPGSTKWYNSSSTYAKTAKMIVEGKISRNGQQYRCVVKDGDGQEITTNVATLTVKELISITGQPASQTVSQGAYATFKVTANGSNLSYQWQYKLPNNTAWYNSGASDAKTASLKVEGKASRNGQQYRCVIKDAKGNIVTSSVATLTVSAPSITITAQPANQTTPEGSSVTFKVTASGNNLSYQWQYKLPGSNAWYNSSSAGAKTASMAVEGKMSRNGQQYRCVIKDGSGAKITSNAATLNVIAPTIVITGQPANQTVAEGKTTTFKVTANGNNLTYQWQYKRPGDTVWYNSSASSAKTASISVEGKASRNGQQYRCVIKDGQGYKVTSNAATLSVN